jgi:sarcosine oxidase subunit gamma
MLSPLAGAAAAGHYGRLSGSAGEEPGVLVSEVRAGLATLTARKGRGRELLTAAGVSFAVELPGPGRCALGGAMSFICCAPDRWLALATPAPAHGMEARLAPLRGLAAVADQSHGALVLRAGGRHVRDALAKGVPIDLHASAFGVGDAAATAVAHIGLLLWQWDEAPSYGLLVARSLAPSFWRWLSASAAAYGLALSVEAEG